MTEALRLDRRAPCVGACAPSCPGFRGSGGSCWGQAAGPVGLGPAGVLGGDRQPDAPKGPGMCCGGWAASRAARLLSNPTLAFHLAPGKPQAGGDRFEAAAVSGLLDEAACTIFGRPGLGGGRLLPPPRAPPRPGEAQGCSPPGLQLLATEDVQQGGGGSSGVEAHTSGLGPGPVTCGRTGHPVCLECVVLMAPAEAPGPRVGPAVLLTAAIVVGADQLALLVCGHRAQLTGPLGQGRKPRGRPSLGQGPGLRGERGHPADTPGG